MTGTADASGLRILRTIYVAVVHLCAIVALAILAAITIGIGAEAILRSLGWGSVHGIVDFAEHGMFSLVFLSAPWVLVRDAHIRIDLFSTRRSATEGPLRVARYGLCAVFCAVVTWFAGGVFVSSYERGELVFQEIILPEWWLQWQVPLCFFLLTVEFARRAAWSARNSDPVTEKLARF